MTYLSEFCWFLIFWGNIITYIGMDGGLEWIISDYIEPKITKIHQNLSTSQKSDFLRFKKAPAGMHRSSPSIVFKKSIVPPSTIEYHRVPPSTNEYHRIAYWIAYWIAYVDVFSIPLCEAYWIKKTAPGARSAPGGMFSWRRNHSCRNKWLVDTRIIKITQNVFLLEIWLC